MKKLTSILSVCAMATVIFTGCGDSDSGIDKNIVGAWHSDELGGDMNFSKDGKLDLVIDYSEYMHFNADGNLVMSGLECEADYDGSNLSVTLGEDMGMDEEMNLISLERIGDANEDSVDGEYNLTGGELYDELITMYDNEENASMKITIAGEDMSISVALCEFTAKDGKLELKGDNLSMLGLDDEDEGKCDYKIDGDTLTLTEASGNTLELTKSK